MAIRILLFLWGVYVAAIALGTDAEAQNYPWCAQYSGGGIGGGTNCGFTTLQQCRDTVSGISGFCELNTQYQPLPGPHFSTAVRRHR